MKIKRIITTALIGTVLISALMIVVPTKNHARCVTLGELTNDSSLTGSPNCPGKQYGWPYAWKQDYAAPSTPDSVFIGAFTLNAAVYFVIIGGLTALIQRRK